jgi:tetratricopeptide (TPR) repeat protein
MIKNLVFIVALSVSVYTHAQEATATIAGAQALVQKKSYAESVSVFQQVFAKKTGNRLEYYDAACAAALAGQHQLALRWLNLAVDKDWRDIQHLKTDTDLKSLHKHPEWKRVVHKLQTKLAILEKNYDHALKAELEAIFTADQQQRLRLAELEKQYGADSEQMKAVWDDIERQDAVNLKRVTGILDTKGWLGPDQVGEKASMTLWLVIQHADVKEWEKYLPGMRKAVQEKKASASHLASLEDRYLAHGLGKKQIYGTQFQTVNGVTRLMPVEDPDHLDERRAAVGLSPIAEYYQLFGLTWDLEAYKKTLAEETNTTHAH